MRIANGYEHVTIVDEPYVPEYKKSQRQLRATRVLQCVNKVTRIPLHTYIKSSEALLASYNKERYRLAQFIYNVVKCARHISADATLKGVAIDVEKSHFLTDTLQDLHGKIEKRCTWFKKISRQIYCVVFAFLGIFLALMAMMWAYPAIAIKTNSYSWPYLGTLIAVGAIFIVVAIIALNLASGVMVNIQFLQREMKWAIGEDYPKYFTNIYNRLHFVREEEAKFLYDIKEGSIEEENRTYHLARDIWLSNDYRLSMNRLSEPLLANMDSELQT